MKYLDYPRVPALGPVNLTVCVPLRCDSIEFQVFNVDELKLNSPPLSKKNTASGGIEP